ncbi:pyrroline-5-carboxylate reductase [Antarcticibacterium flavum]|uniref:Pyrroline-5-carboxylate reductase n=1 Tax=Antarcticibacterium flavum TaxID=2058175 RepID=A0A5B7X042_9FLAO|nr:MULTISPECIES: pyrroline-5-carboxylate reductase [Antarcticibacterium]MCM4160227.1 pyrroline-5-carboxylate reductase [Antarcticibacterium sp. W02-3]QCY68697.1 pyrroline-5-carboxylate reductase [Antarcticibacterium flavum]
MKIAIIGTGNLGQSIAKGLVTSNSFTSLYLTRRKTAEIESFKDNPNIRVTANNIAAVNGSEILILAVQPTQLENILEEIKPHLTAKHVIISTVTGFSIDRIQAIVGEDKYILRAMPNTAIAVGKSMTCLCSNTNGQNQIPVAEAIFKKLGSTIIIPENKMQAATVICASGIAFWMRLIRATTQGAIQLGFDAKDAHELSMQTCLGAASLLLDSGKHPEEEIDKVTTPMGCTIEGLNEMEHNGLSSSLIKGIKASFNKINTITNT